MGLYFFSIGPWMKIKEYLGVYDIKNLDYSYIKDNVNISFIIHNFKKYNDPCRRSIISKANTYGCIPALYNSYRIPTDTIYKIIAEGFKSKKFYEAIKVLLNRPDKKILDIFYEHPSAFVWRMRHSGKMAPCTRDYMFKFWSYNSGLQSACFIQKVGLKYDKIYFDINKLSLVDKILFEHGPYFGDIELPFI
jgi:hypothetical protein